MAGVGNSVGSGEHSNFYTFNKFSWYSYKCRRAKHKKYIKLWFLKNANGAAAIETVIAIPLIAFILFASVQYWGIFNVRQQAEHIKDKYLSRMEIDGNLTADNVANLRDDLLAIGADPNTITVTINGGTNAVILRPGHVSLKIEFQHKYFDNFLSRLLIGGNPSQNIVIRVGGETVSERVK